MTGRHAETQPLWSPTPERVADARITRFSEFVSATRAQSLAGYNDLWRWSVTDLEGFWAAVWEFFGLDAVSGYDRVLADAAMPGAQWFPGAEVNFAGHLLAQGEPDQVAIVGCDESGATQRWTRAQLREQTAALAATLSRLGVGPGDMVVGYLPNIAETVIAFLATASLGATWSSVGQDYAASAVVDRFAQLSPKVLVCADGYRFNGNVYDRGPAVAAIREGLPSLEQVIMVERLGTPAGDVIAWTDAVAEPAELRPAAVPFAHPLWVLFSSGTTGKPKGLVHGHGGILVEMLKLLGLHLDLDGSDRLFWYTSPSWMMWNFQLSALATGASIVCYDGSPAYPDTSALWKLVADAEVTYFGTSPGYLQASEKAGVRPANDFDLSALREVGTTGSPLPAQSHRWATEQLAGLPVNSVSGGTDVCSGFCGGAPTVPVWPGEISVRNLGVAMEAWSERGEPVYDEVGELVITRPMPSMPIHFWDDPDASRYTEAYFSTFPGVWRHGDWITVTERGGIVIHGRSDSTLNRHGIRMGSADIYAAVETIPEVTEALVIGAEQEDGSYWMPLFVVLPERESLDAALADRIRTAIRELASPRHVPDEIIQVPGIPHTRTGKKL
jgi:acetoacetyl-CoA synthetase